MAYWTPQEDDIIKRYYNATYNKSTIVNLLNGKTWFTIQRRAMYLGVKRTPFKLLLKIIKYVCVEKETNCWNWRGHLSPTGYATGRYNGRYSNMFHRIVYEYFCGEIKNDLHCHHVMEIL